MKKLSHIANNSFPFDITADGKTWIFKPRAWCETEEMYYRSMNDHFCKRVNYPEERDHKGYNLKTFSPFSYKDKVAENSSDYSASFAKIKLNGDIKNILYSMMDAKFNMKWNTTRLELLN